MRTKVTYLLLLFFAFGAGGCDQSTNGRVPVGGTVRIDGQPLTSGTIRFVPEIGRPTSSTIMADGSFDLASESVNRISQVGVAPGTYRVQVSASKIVDENTIHWNAPERYADFRTSGLDVTIDRPRNDLVIELTWKGETPTEGGAIDAETDGPDANSAASSTSGRQPQAPDAESAQP